ncbi:hypothetical protein [Roseiconus lacunae]|uniref:MAPEG family protein n=1 Tax=Roseiconus lacunae TaxID=2605694 RepID=A0ABT7PHU7_9BACT|nr:hypothetical protein [Roseiconus lacunae]MDM4015821.1 hypothetical protein [Roseiconus lacunae]
MGSLFVSETIAMCLLAVAVVTGARVMFECSGAMQEFRGRDVLAGRLDAMLYLQIVVSTSICLLDIVLKLYWITHGPRDTVSTHWQIIYNYVIHCGLPALAYLIHASARRVVLDRDAFLVCRALRVARRKPPTTESTTERGNTGE